MWVPKQSNKVRSSWLVVVFQLLRRARGKITLGNLLSVAKWRYLFERIKREITVIRQAKHKPRHRAALSPTDAYILHNTLRPELHSILREGITRFDYLPTISLLMPVYNVDPRWLSAAIESVIDQIYPHWELCIADDASTKPETLATLKQYEGRDKIKITYRSENGHICAASNSAADLASGDFVAMLDNDDTLASNALFEIVRLLNAHPEADLIYSDEDKIDAQGRHYDLHFKPDWSPVLLLGYNYINHLTCIRRSLFEAVGRFSVGFEGAQDYELLLRVTERTQNIFHIPKILYHWRSIPESTASSAGVKPIVDASAQKALESYLCRHNISATLYRPSFAELHGLPINQLNWSDTGPTVNIILYGLGDSAQKAQCIRTIEKNTTYQRYQITTCQTLSTDSSSTLSARLNTAANASETELILFLNDQLKVTEPRWLSRLVGYLSLPGVGITGARLINSNATIHSAGTVIVDSSFFPAFSGESSRLLSYFFLAETARDCSAVDIACLLAKRQAFLKAGGFDEVIQEAEYAIDYGLRLMEQGLRTVFVAGAELQFSENAPNPIAIPADRNSCKSRYKRFIDRYYNQNLLPPRFSPNPSSHLDYGDFASQPLKCAFYTHNLNLEGAPKVILNLAIELQHLGAINSLVFSPVSGPAEEHLHKSAIPFEIIQPKGCDSILSGWADIESFNATIEQTVEVIKLEKPDIVVANVLNSFFVIEAAYRAGIPCIWIIHESYHRDLLVRAIDSKAFPVFEQAFAKANAVVFVSEETSQLYKHYDQILNLTVIRNALSKAFIDTLPGSKSVARHELGIPPDKRVIVSIGTVCERKDQKTLVRAIEVLAQARNDFMCFVVGWRSTDHYCSQVSNLIEQLRLTNHIVLVPETKDVARYYSVADIFAFTSLNESYSLTILEAMAFGLPIVTTQCVGIAEQVQFNVNALSFDFQDHQALSQHLASLLDEDEKRSAMGQASRRLFENLPTSDKVTDNYRNLILSAWQAGSLNGRL